MIFVKYFEEILHGPTILIHSLPLSVCSQFLPVLFVMMHTVRWLVVAVVTEPYHKPMLFGLFLERSSEYVVPFKPYVRVADQASFGILL